MLTPIEFNSERQPQQAEHLRDEVASLRKQLGKTQAWVLQILRTLNEPGALSINSATIEASYGIKFPATQNASSDVNTLDDYEKDDTGTDLAITFATPGDLAVNYTVRKFFYTKVGNRVHGDVAIITSAFTHTTAAGELRITGFPFTPKNTANRYAVGALDWSGITKAGYTHCNLLMDPGVAYGRVIASGSGVASSALTSANMPTGGTIILIGHVSYVV